MPAIGDERKGLVTNVRFSSVSKSYGTVQAIGNVSLAAPAIHPKLAIAPVGVATHTAAFARYAGSGAADRAVLDGAKAMALTALDVWAGPAGPGTDQIRPTRRRR